MTVTAITPTRDRPEAFSLCCRWMSTQKLKEPLQWIVVDDGDVPVKGGPFEYIRRTPSFTWNTLPDNLIAALPRVKGDRVVIFEDDDYYAPEYLSMMFERLKTEWLSGEVAARYYNVQSRRWNINKHKEYASLCRTGFQKRLISMVQKAAKETKRLKDVSVDMRLWEEATRTRVPMGLFAQPKLTVSIKGLPGRGGLGRNHAPDHFPNKDPQGAVLRSWIGDGPFLEYSKVYE